MIMEILINKIKRYTYSCVYNFYDFKQVQCVSHFYMMTSLFPWLPIACGCGTYWGTYVVNIMPVVLIDLMI